ncbi:hypothetical protein Sta7437_4892 (plasmid) [Stanieria cyanosphaera PCC 7437]|uniref:Uncharacterized protein n=1 Tax=Stanieria cyanosphaera (strain ATCC 29371 / PCC 7437) TaxID=111780 RepID=K9Y0G6_STAC7|nr:hypothetical protein [Stanieria cyanosphaera]AFZ38320.1 hypothetical protein Sta7437_4892 [Stanieria cyanosphaera PCC 7437]
MNKKPKKWRCYGGRNGQPGHKETMVNIRQKCNKCGEDQPNVSTSSEQTKPKKDVTLLALLTVLNIGSGYTTIKGALQMFPVPLAWSVGGVIQTLLFLSTSRYILNHAPKRRWLTILVGSTLSIYTSFFAYYEFLTSEGQKQQALERASTAHDSLVFEVYTPIERKVSNLKSEIETKELRIEEEIAGNRASGLPGCGSICKQLKNEKEELQNRYNKLLPVAKNLKSLFEYQIEGKTPKAIFETDLRALSKVSNDCLPEDPNFDCLPQEYERVLNPRSTDYREFRGKYIDEDSIYILLQPYHKIRKLEPPAIAAGVLAITLDGLIIALGTGIEVSEQKKKRKKNKTDILTLSILGKGSNFIEQLLHEIDSKNLTINYTNSQKKDLQLSENKTSYLLLLNKINTNLGWVENDKRNSSSEAHWQITSDSNSQKLRDWLINERERLINEEMKNDNKTQASKLQKVTFRLPRPQDLSSE